MSIHYKFIVKTFLLAMVNVDFYKYSKHLLSLFSGAPVGKILQTSYFLFKLGRTQGKFLIFWALCKICIRGKCLS